MHASTMPDARACMHLTPAVCQHKQCPVCWLSPTCRPAVADSRTAAAAFDGMIVLTAADGLKLPGIRQQLLQVQQQQDKAHGLQQQVLAAISASTQAQTAVLEQLAPVVAQLQEQDTAAR